MIIYNCCRFNKKYQDVPALNLQKPLKDYLDYLAGAKLKDLKKNIKIISI